MNKVDVVESAHLRNDIPPFRPGDQVKVHVNIREGGRERIQVFEGVVIARRGGGLRESFTVRKISFGVGVERTFPLHAPAIAKVEVVRHGKVRRAKLYYLRALTGKKAKIEERRSRIPTWPPPEQTETEPDVAELADTEAEAAEAPAATEAAEMAAGAPAAETAVEEPAAEGPAEVPAAEAPAEDVPAEETKEPEAAAEPAPEAAAETEDEKPA